jgi:hypothetical protein
MADFFYYNDTYSGHNWLQATSEVGEVELSYTWLKGWSKMPGFSHHFFSNIGFEIASVPFLNQPPWHVIYMGFGVAHIFYSPSHNPQYKESVWHNEYSICLPYWFIAAMLLLYPIAKTGLVVRRWTRRRKGCCTKCGYDLRGTPHRCPECGTETVTSARGEPQNSRNCL